jgi:hypothetical protein
VKEKYYYVWLKCDVGIYCSMLLRVIDIIDWKIVYFYAVINNTIYWTATNFIHTYMLSL